MGKGDGKQSPLLRRIFDILGTDARENDVKLRPDAIRKLFNDINKDDQKKYLARISGEADDDKLCKSLKSKAGAMEIVLFEDKKEKATPAAKPKSSPPSTAAKPSKPAVSMAPWEDCRCSLQLFCVDTDMGPIPPQHQNDIGPHMTPAYYMVKRDKLSEILSEAAGKPISKSATVIIVSGTLDDLRRIEKEKANYLIDMYSIEQHSFVLQHDTIPPATKNGLFFQLGSQHALPRPKRIDFKLEQPKSTEVSVQLVKPMADKGNYEKIFKKPRDNYPIWASALIGKASIEERTKPFYTSCKDIDFHGDNYSEGKILGVVRVPIENLDSVMRLSGTQGSVIHPMEKRNDTSLVNLPSECSLADAVRKSNNLKHLSLGVVPTRNGFAIRTLTTALAETTKLLDPERAVNLGEALTISSNRTFILTNLPRTTTDVDLMAKLKGWGWAVLPRRPRNIRGQICDWVVHADTTPPAEVIHLEHGDIAIYEDTKMTTAAPASSVAKQWANIVKNSCSHTDVNINAWMDQDEPDPFGGAQFGNASQQPAKPTEPPTTNTGTATPQQQAPPPTTASLAPQTASQPQGGTDNGQAPQASPHAVPAAQLNSGSGNTKHPPSSGGASSIGATGGAASSQQAVLQPPFGPPPPLPGGWGAHVPPAFLFGAPPAEAPPPPPQGAAQGTPQAPAQQDPFTFALTQQCNVFAGIQAQQAQAIIDMDARFNTALAQSNAAIVQMQGKQQEDLRLGLSQVMQETQQTNAANMLQMQSFFSEALRSALAPQPQGQGVAAAPTATGNTPPPPTLTEPPQPAPSALPSSQPAPPAPQPSPPSAVDDDPNDDSAAGRQMFGQRAETPPRSARRRSLSPASSPWAQQRSSPPITRSSKFMRAPDTVEPTAADLALHNELQQREISHQLGTLQPPSDEVAATETEAYNLLQATMDLRQAQQLAVTDDPSAAASATQPAAPSNLPLGTSVPSAQEDAASALAFLGNLEGTATGTASASPRADATASTSDASTALNTS